MCSRHDMHSEEFSMEEVSGVFLVDRDDPEINDKNAG